MSETFRQFRQAPEEPERQGGYQGVSHAAPIPTEGSWSQVHSGNLLCGARTSRPFSSKDLPASNGQQRLIVPFQFSGIATTPGDVFPAMEERDLSLFFQGLFELLRRFLVMAVTFAGMLWSQFLQQIVLGGDTDRMTEAWQSLDRLREKKDEIITANPKQHPRIPSDILPTQNIRSVSYLKPTSNAETGLGVWAEDSSGCWHQLVDRQRTISRTINRRKSDGQLLGWSVPLDTVRIHFAWLSQNHALNDGDCFGSITVVDSPFPVP